MKLSDTGFLRIFHFLEQNLVQHKESESLDLELQIDSKFPLEFVLKTEISPETRYTSINSNLYSHMPKYETFDSRLDHESNEHRYFPREYETFAMKTPSKRVSCFSMWLYVQSNEFENLQFN